ncbi:hypothetical protein MZM54_00105 [[Brevibacterium] frigoritolerans]|nr:hypothetical protein [Peribacillus frigoritolerans]
MRKLTVEEIVRSTKADAEVQSEGMNNPLVIPIYVAVDRDETGKVVTVISQDHMKIFQDVEINEEQPAFSYVQYSYFKGYMDELFEGNNIDEFSKYYHRLTDQLNKDGVSVENISKMKETYDNHRKQRGYDKYIGLYLDDKGKY